jgi:hypothetical protein
MNDTEFEASFEEILTHWQDQEPSRHRFEGETGVETLNELTTAIGYQRGLEHFLEDNPGAIEAIVEWIEEQADQGYTGWKSKLADECEFVDADERD